MTRGTIFCDESGFTGADLLDAQDPYFSFATVAIPAAEAQVLVNRVIKDYGVQGGELKGRRLLKYARGRRAVAEIFAELEGRFKVAIFEKRYALACKFYEYIFEPSLASHSLIFYSLRFHLFVANLLYLHFTQSGHHADRIFAEFQDFMRTFDETRLLYLNGKLHVAEQPPALELVGAFAAQNFAAVRKEVDSLIGPTGKWTLDLSSTALHSLLGEWAETYDELEVTCDESKPLAASKAMLDAMIGNDRKAYHVVSGEKRRLTYNLARPIEMRRSIDTPGVQLADVIASVTAATFETPQHPDHETFRDSAFAGISGNVAVLPMLSEIDLDEVSVQRNYLILHDLVRRSLGREVLLPGAADFAMRITETMRLPIPDLDAAFIRD